MRVLFVTGEYPPMQGGVGDYTRELGTALCRLGAEVHVLTRASGGLDRANQPASCDEPVLHRVLMRSGWNLWRQTARLANELGADAVHIQYQSAAYDLHPAVNYLPWYLRHRPAGRATYATFHDLRVPYIFPKAGRLRWQAVLSMARWSDAAIVTNPTDYAALLAADAGLAARIAPIPIGSNIHPQAPPDYDRSAQRNRWGIGPEDWLLAYFGFLNANKGGETLVRALAALVESGRPARLLMVGGQVGASDPTNAAYLAHVKGLIAELGLANCVQWTGFTPAGDVSANLMAADCATLPYREGASLRHGSLMAALAHGLPVVTTAQPSRPHDPTEQAAFPELQDQVSARLVPPEDPIALADAITQVMIDPALREALARGSLALARRFDWESIAQQHLTLYGRRT